ncbi:MAG TPA: VIT domain-containing protein, partial [Candidatus Eisenbacteria bacterium]|nr:VIT domain-containing protein [Candidatus Eisenbacteria bacterium]
MAPQDSIVPAQEPRSPALVSVDGRTYPLRSAHVRGRAEGGLAQTTVVQVFTNPHAEPLEVLYTMPLPADGAVLGYTVRIGERVIRGEIRPREEAEAEYKKALYQGRSAGLLEQDRADTFQQRLGNVPPHMDVQVEIDVLHPLAFLAAVDANGPLWEYRFPTVVSVRYEGAPGRVTDKDRLDIDRAEAAETGGIPTRFDVSLTVVDDVIANGGIVSPSHQLHCVANATGVHVTLPEDARLDRDLVLHWPAALEDVGVKLVEGRGLPGDDGRYALLTITPPKRAHASFPRDLTILVDASGSMSGEPLDTAKQIVTGILESLVPEDRFEIIAFASKPEKLTRGMESASPKAVAGAIRKVRALRADGGTEMLDAMTKALAPLRRNSQRQIVLVTDGQVGFEDEVTASLGPQVPSGVRVHAIGIGHAVNRTLTSLVARAGRGVELIAAGMANADEMARRIRTATVRPVLTDLHVGGSALVGIAPARPRDVYAGQPLVLALELKPEGGTLEVQGALAGSNETWVWRTDVGATSQASANRSSTPLEAAAHGTTLPIGALYGREAIADAETFTHASLARKHGLSYDHRLLDPEIERLGMRHRITSRRTSLVAIAEEPSVDPLQPRRREKLVLEIPYGVSAEGLGLEGSRAFAKRLADSAHLVRSATPVFGQTEDSLERYM